MRKFMVIWFGEFISSIGSGMTSFAISTYIYQLTSSSALVSLSALLAYLPTILLNPVGGIFADRYDRRLMMILGDSLSAIGLVFILLCMKGGYTGVIPIFIGLTISSIFTSLLEPAYKATITDLLTEEEYAKASGLVQIAGASKYLISPFIAGIILSFTDISTILIIDISTIFVTVLSVFLVRKAIIQVKVNKKNYSILTEFKEGINSVASHDGVKDLVILMGFMCFFVAFIQTLIIPMILAFADSKTLGIMESISAVGMLIGSVVIGILNINKNYTKVLRFSLMACGLFMAMVGTTTNIVIIIISCILFFASLPFVNTCADVLIRMRMPNEVQGRAWGIISVLTQIGYIAAYSSCGFMADYVFGPMLMKNGILADSIGKIIGVGEGRGIGLMLIISGIVMFCFAFIFGSKKSIKEMEKGLNELAHIKK